MSQPHPPDESNADAGPSPGVQLRVLREAAQLTVDDVAHHLKLARRQVVAIENDDHGALPGPTFVRGFIRNYARLLRVDAQPLLEAGHLAVAPAEPVPPISRTVSELPLDNGSKTSWTRWLIPVGLLLVLIGGIAVYEMSDVSVPVRKARKESTEPVIAPPALPSTAESGVAAAGSAQPAAPATAAQGPAATPAPAAPPPEIPGAANPATSPTTPGPGRVATGAVASGQPATTAGQARLDFEFSGPSWVEVRDSQGELLLSRTLSANSTQTLAGTPPLSLRIGNVSAVSLKFNGAPIDLKPHSQREIARLTLPLGGR